MTPSMRAGLRIAGAALAVALTAVAPGVAGAQDAPEPGSPEYVQRDARNMLDGYGRQTGPGGQFSPEYLAEVVPNGVPQGLGQLYDQASDPTRPALTPGNFFPGWNNGNAFRFEWDGKRGIEIPIAFTNRYGALLRGHVSAPLPGARDPYSGRRLKPPFPAVVITTGSVQGSERMYTWLAQDLAERGYVVLTYDVQGQGTSETLPHAGSPAEDLGFCDPSGDPAEGEMTGCPGVPSQQTANFVHGTLDATDFMYATPREPYANPSAGSAKVDAHNPLWRLVDRRPDGRTDTPGRTNRLAIIGHSLGASAVSWVQAFDERVMTVVGLDKLRAGASFAGRQAAPVVPGLGLQADYGFWVQPYWADSGSPGEAPDPARERRTGFDGWQEAGVDSMVVVPRAASHLDWTDINFVLPASRYGQALSSVYTQAWLDKYLKHRKGADRRLTATEFRYLEPSGGGEWTEIGLQRDPLLSFYFCSAWDFTARDGATVADEDVTGVGCG